MTCSRRFGRTLQASSLALIGMLTVVGCGGSDSDNKRDGGKQDTLGVDTYVPPVGKVNVTPSFLDFQTVDVGASSTAQAITVTVSGAAVAISPTIVGAGFALASNTCAALQAPGTPCAIGVKFAPASVGAANGVLTVGSSTVSLVGIGNQPGVFTAPDRIELGTLKLNATAAVTVQIAPQGTVQSLSCTSSSPTELAPNAAATTCPATGPVSAACVYAFTFNAATAGLRTDTVTCSGGGKVTQTAVTASVVGAAVLAVSQPSALFNAVVGKTDSVVITVSNNGGSATVAAPTASVTVGATDFAVTANDCVVALAPLATCKVTVSFAPKAAGSKPGTLTVTDSVTTLPVTLTGTAVADRNVAITPSPADFASVYIGSSTPMTFTMKNTGGTATGLITLSGGTEEFKIGSDQCSGSALAATNGQCTFVVTFAPIAPASTTPRATIINASDAAGVVANVKVSGIAAPARTGVVLTMTPPSLDFGTIGVGTTAGPKVFTVTNTGDADSAATVSVIKSDSTSSQFTSTTTCTGTIAVGASCQVVVTFAPTIRGSASATFTVTDGGVSTKASAVVGIALEKPGLEIKCPTSSTTFGTPYDFSAAAVGSTPAGVEVGGTVVGKTSAAVVCFVQNNSASTQDTGTLTVSTTGDFAVAATGNTCTASLAPGLSCTVNVTFKPTVKGDRSGAITVAGANGGVANVNLLGLGLGVVEIKEYVCTPTVADATLATGVTSCAVASTTAEAQPFDFAQVTAGTNSSTYLLLEVFVRGSVGNLSVTPSFGTPKDFAFQTVAAAMTITGTGAITGNFVDCGSLGTTNPYDATRPATTPACVKIVRFTPQTKTAKTGSVAAAGADTTSDTATVKGTGAGPITISPSPLNFATVGVGSSEILTLTVKNNGALNVTDAAITLGGTDAAQFVVTKDGVSGQNINAGLSKEIEVRFMPTATGAKSAKIDVSGKYGTGTEDATVNLTGTGVTASALTATLGGEFASTAINATSAPVVVTVTNPAGGAASGNITYSITGEFTVSAPSGQTLGTCSSSNSTPLAAGASCTINVWFKPTSGLGVSARKGILTVSGAPGGQVTLNLTANATAQLTLNPATTVDFGDVVVLNGDSTTKTITLTNHADAAATITPVLGASPASLIPSNPAAFRIVTDNCTGATVDGKGGTCTIVAQMVPQAADHGAQYASVTFTDSAAANPGAQYATVALGGVAKTDAKLEYTAATALDRNYGTVLLGQPSAPVKYTLKNKGEVATGPLSIKLFDNDAAGAVTTTEHAKVADFNKTTGTTCSTDAGLAAGETCDIVVTFTPTACSGSCTTTTSVDVSLVVKASPGSATKGIVIGGTDTSFPRLRGIATTTTTGSAYLVESVTGKSPYQLPALGTAATITTVLTFRNGTGPTNAAVAAIADVFYGPDGVDVGTDPDPLAAPNDGKGTVSAGCVTGASCEFAQTATTCTTTQATGTSCSTTIVWTPTSTAGKREVNVTVGGATMTLTASVPSDAALSISPTTLAFGSVRQDTDSATLTFTVTNDNETATEGNLVATKTAGTTAPVTILAPTAATDCQGNTLAAGKSCTISVKVKPSAAGPATATVTVASTNKSGSISTVGTVTWTGKAAAQVSPAPSSVNFGTVAVKQSIVAGNTQSIVLSNQANGLLTGALNITVDSGDFAVSALNPLGAAGGTDCGKPDFADGLDSSESCTIYVSFSPNAVTPVNKSGKITITTSSGAGAEITVFGKATAALSVTSQTVSSGTQVLTPAPAVTFSSTAVSAGAAGPTVIVTFTNAASNLKTGILSAGLTGANVADFRIIDDQCTGLTVDSGSTCTVKVLFDPATAGTGKTATLTVSGTPGDSASTTMTGTATNS